jgi:hypothetical protein
VAFSIYSEAAISVAIVGDADIRAVLEHSSDEVLQVRAAASLIDVQTIWRRVDGHDVGACTTHRLGRDSRCRAVSAVNHDR